MSLNCLGYKELANLLGKSGMSEAIQEFAVSRNKDVENFLHTQARHFEEDHNTRNYFIVDDEARILACFAIAIHSLTIDNLLPDVPEKLISKIRGYGKKYARSIGCCLLGQLARNDSASKNEIPGSEILKIILRKLRIAQEIVGGRFVALDCVDTLVPYYEKMGFERVEQRENLNTMVLIIQVSNAAT